MDNVALDAALDALEALESRSLSWGFVDQTLSEPEAVEAIRLALAAAASTESPEDVLGALCDAELVRMLGAGGDRRYRSRFAEMVRLLSRLRQWFDGRPWQAAPTLVSDFRIDRRKRHYPRRNISPDAAWGRLSGARSLSDFQRRVWQALTQRADFSLSEFQVTSAGRLLTAAPGSGTVITAGTGSGKTLAFYLPALVAVAPEIRKNEWWTKAVCLYPRQELLKDQLSEAYRLAHHAGPLLQQSRRPVVFGSLFRLTPSTATVRDVAQAGWEEDAQGFVCPFIRCPVCSREMKWLRQALQNKTEELRCVDPKCSTRIDSTTLRLTRQSSQNQPPDFLFTTTEMLNQRLSDTWTRHLFGVKTVDAKTPLFALLDEAHTYAGISGAQVALLLRRWAALLGAKVRWAGLSATLPRAQQFFAELTGARPDDVVSVAPAADDMISEGAEYTIILRSDASSQVATLSTSIQAIMLLARMLDPVNRPVSGGRFGSRSFVFTDDLDVTNRLFDNLLDAEAYTRFRKPDQTRLPLAALRGTNQIDRVSREADGQCWEMAEALHTSLENRLQIGRTTSRDPGVNAAANVIVATSTLEVGFNDPTVGVVFQHKAPRSAASFLQRRGRAGRNRSMRPLTVVVLSDYGRDRVAFQSFEELFDPVVEIQSLPIKNLYVLRIQAVYSILEWIAARAPASARGWSWRIFSGPPLRANDDSFRNHARDLIRQIVRLDPPTLDALQAHLRQALGIDAATLNNVLWQSPRPVLLEALPTLARRFFRNWQLASGPGHDFHVAAPPQPLPDFVPPNLFSDLNLPEVQIRVPARNGDLDREALPIVQALQQFAPGRVRRRFADQQGRLSHWFPLDVTQPDQNVVINAYASHRDYLGNVGSISVFRPWEIEVAPVPPSVSDVSNARWHWQSRFEAQGEAKHIPMPASGGVELIVEPIDFRLHRFGAAISVWRYTHKGEAALRVNTREQRIAFRLVDEQSAPAAVGFVFEADAMRVPFRLPSREDLAQLRLPHGVQQWLRYLALNHYVENSPLLQAGLNSFQRDWLHQIVLLSAIVLAERESTTLAAALQRLRNTADVEPFRVAIAALGGASNTPWPDEPDDDQPPAAASSRLATSLNTALSDPEVMRETVDLALRWTAPSTTEWGQWLSELARSTLAEAVFQACVTVAPDNAATDGLTVDIDETDATLRAIIAETTLGGGGTVEALAEAFASDPRAFIRGLESACAPSDREMAADALRRVLALLETDASVAAALTNLRASNDTQGRDEMRREFFRLLALNGIPASRTLSILIGARLVRPGATPDSDRLTLRLLRAWEMLEGKYGIALPSRLAAAAIVLTRLVPELANFGGAQRELLTAGMLLWPAGGELRQRALQSYNPFRAAPLVDAALARLLLFETNLPIVSLDTPGWQAQMVDALASRGIVRLVTAPGDLSWRESITRILGEPIVSGFLQFYPMIEATRVLDDGRFAMDLVLRDRV